MGRAIGIDLGTTNSCAAVIDGDTPVIIPSDDGGRTTPSVIAFTNKGEQLVGAGAKRQAAVNAENTIFSIKRQMGSGWSKNIYGKTYRPQELSAMILRKLKKDAEKFLGESVTDAVITVPAYFNDIERQATKDAGRIAGLNVLRIINEPTSAALAYGLDHGAAQKIMVYDLGGGTFDVSIIEIGSGVIEVLATAGDNHLGGDDFDECLAKYITDNFKKENGIDLTKDKSAARRVREAAEQAKKDLSETTVANVNLPFITQTKQGPYHLEMNISRDTFNSLTKHLVDRTQGPVRTALSDAGIAASELGMVLLVGGSTRIPAVQDKVRALTGKMPSKSINPDECVAQGAAVQAKILSGGALIVGGGQNVLLLDVTPLSLSIETVGGVATRLVERNSTLPVHYSRVFTTASNYQPSVDIHVLQGERPMARDNKTIGRFKLRGIRRAPAGVPRIEVTFDIDPNGILQVGAKDLDTGKQQSITITSNEKMSNPEIQKAIEDARQYESQDTLRKEILDDNAKASEIIERKEKELAESGKTMDKATKRRIKADCATLRKLVAKNSPVKPSKDATDEVKHQIVLMEQY